MIIEKIKKSFFPFLLASIALFASVIGIYSFYVDKHASVDMRIINASNVLDIHRPLEDLSILFFGEDIQKKNLNLRIYTVQFKNTGNIDILQNFYDQKDIWGLSVTDGTIMSVRTLRTNSVYIEENLKPTIQEDSVIRFNKIIFEKGKYFVVEIFVLHSKDALPKIDAIGKIAGIDNKNIEEDENNQRESFFEALLHGNIFVHFVRFLSYLIFLPVLMVPIIIISIFTDKRGEKIRGMKVRILFSSGNLADTIENRKITDLYINHGPGVIRELARLEDTEDRSILHSHRLNLPRKIIFDLIREDFIVFDDQHMRLDTNFKTQLIKFVHSEL